MIPFNNFVLWALIQMGELAEVRAPLDGPLPRVEGTRGPVRNLEADHVST